jgi:hypothetical protein
VGTHPSTGSISQESGQGSGGWLIPVRRVVVIVGLLVVPGNIVRRHVLEAASGVEPRRPVPWYTDGPVATPFSGIIQGRGLLLGAAFGA